MHYTNEIQRPLTGLQIISTVTNMFLNDPVTSWRSVYRSFDLPSYTLSIACTVVTAISLAIPPENVDLALPVIMDVFSVDQSTKAFLLDSYLPEASRRTYLPFSFMYYQRS